MRGPDGGTDEVFETAGGHYRAQPNEISSDLWVFEAALDRAGRSPDEETTGLARRRAVDACRGDLLDEAEDPAIEPVRANLHLCCVDASIRMRLVELEGHAGFSEVAVAAWERSVKLDYDAEEPNRRRTALQFNPGRPNAMTCGGRETPSTQLGPPSRSCG